MVSDFSFTSGISAMRAHSKAFAAISNNVSNLNTAGFKHTEILTQSLTSDSSGGGIYGNYSGTSYNAFNRFDREGTVIGTQRALDGSLFGKGFFVTSGSLNGDNPRLTANGQFATTINPDNAGESYLTDGSGNYVLGWTYDPNTSSFNASTNVSSIGPIRTDKNSTNFAPVASSNAELTGNLSASATPGTVATLSFEVWDGTGSADEVGDAQPVNAIFTKSATPNTWDVSFTADNGTITSNPATFQLQFDAAGQNPTIVNESGTSVNLTGDWSNSGVQTSFNFDMRSISQISGESRVNRIDVDGYNAGTLNGTYLGDKGILYGRFTNGVTRPVAKLAIGDVRNPAQLNAVNGTYFETTSGSGRLEIFDPEVTTRAEFVAGTIEGSSTNLNNEFTNIIVTQRAYSSAATTLRTADEMMQTAQQMK